MFGQIVPESNYLIRMADGTIKQINPFTGTEVWTVPGRANRPLDVDNQNVQRLDPAEDGAHCAFCEKRYLNTPPEKARLVEAGNGYATLRNLRAEELSETVAEYRRVPNLFEIVSLDYWQMNFGYQLPESVESRKHAYLATE
ncbi:MAG: DUF4921 family protein, partial [Hyphomicrobium sp.]